MTTKEMMSEEEGLAIANGIDVGSAEIDRMKAEIRRIISGVFGLVTQQERDLWCFPRGRPPGMREACEKKFSGCRWEFFCSPQQKSLPDADSRRYLLNVACHLRDKGGGSHRAFDFLPGGFRSDIALADVQAVRRSMGGFIALMVWQFPFLPERWQPLLAAAKDNTKECT